MKKILLGLFFVFTVLGVTSFSVAASLTQDQVNAILNLLRSFGAEESVISNVQGALTGKNVPQAPAAWCHTFNTNLRIGDMTSEKDGFGDTKYLQQALMKEGFSISQNEYNGRYLMMFGESTAAAVTAFQEKYRDEILTPNGLSHGTGYVGASTRAKLNQLYRCATSPTKPQEPRACTTEAKQCPDGSYVGRSGPNCEFAACPSVSSSASLKVLTPNGGEQYKVGSSIAFIWQQDYSSEFMDLMLNNPLTGTQYSIKVQGSIGKNVYTVPASWTQIPGEFRAHICDNQKENPALPGKLLCDISDSPFNIVQ